VENFLNGGNTNKTVSPSLWEKEGDFLDKRVDILSKMFRHLTREEIKKQVAVLDKNISEIATVRRGESVKKKNLKNPGPPG
jgi:hypothetical protein